MNKKLIAIIAVAAAILIIAVVAIVSVGNKVEPAGKDMNVQAGVEDSIFDGESTDGKDVSDDSKNGAVSDNGADNTSKDSDKKNNDKELISNNTTLGETNESESMNKNITSSGRRVSSSHDSPSSRAIGIIYNFDEEKPF